MGRSSLRSARTGHRESARAPMRVLMNESCANTATRLTLKTPAACFTVHAFSIEQARAIVAAMVTRMSAGGLLDQARTPARSKPAHLLEGLRCVRLLPSSAPRDVGRTTVYLDGCAQKKAPSKRGEATRAYELSLLTAKARQSPIRRPANSASLSTGQNRAIIANFSKPVSNCGTPSASNQSSE